MNEANLIEEIRKGAYHLDGLATYACVEVEEGFFLRIREDVLRLITAYPIPAIDPKSTTDKSAYVQPKGEYLYWSLLTKGGDFTDKASAYSKTFLGKAFHHDDEFPALGEFIRAFPEAMNFTLRGLSKASSVSPHEERNFHRLDDLTYIRVRLHLPITTTPESRMMLGGRIYHYEARKIYYFNNGCVHAASNPGQGSRLHLIWDLFLTRELYGDVFDQDSKQTRAPFLRKIGNYDDTGYIDVYGRGAYLFNSRLGKLPQWTVPWFWNNLWRCAEFHAGKDRNAMVHDRETFHKKLSTNGQ